MLTLRPLVLTAGGQSRLALAGLAPGQAYRIVILPARERGARFEQQGIADATGRLEWTQIVGWQGAANCQVFAGDSSEALATLHTYAAPADLAVRRPLRCDLHIHTTYSDGKSSPSEMVVRGRKLGLDVLAITDHNHYGASLEAIDAARRACLGLICYPGEEVTAPTWHLLAIGTTAPVGYAPERAGYAGMRASIDIIHRLGGRAYLAHPYWSIENGRHHLTSGDYERLLAEGGLDGIELLGDVDWEDNLRSLARYHELDPARRPPILSNSDTHRREHTYGTYWTLVFATSATHAGVLAAIADYHSVACALLTLGQGSQPARPHLAAYGPFELVDLALFLDRHYYPLHDALCRNEAELGRRLLAGDPLPAGAMARVRAELAALEQECWGNNSNSEGPAGCRP